MHSPKIEKIEIAAKGDVRRAKLYYLRGRVGRAARVRERRFDPRAQAELEAQELALAEQEAAPILTDEGTEEPAEQLEALEGGDDAATDAPEATDEAPEATDEAPGDAEDAPEGSDAEAAPADDAPTADADPKA